MTYLQMTSNDFKFKINATVHIERVVKWIQKLIAHCNSSTVQRGALKMDSAGTVGELGLIVKSWWFREERDDKITITTNISEDLLT
jgi:hypothetical protein